VDLRPGLDTTDQCYILQSAHGPTDQSARPRARYSRYWLVPGTRPMAQYSRCWYLVPGLGLSTPGTGWYLVPGTRPRARYSRYWLVPGTWYQA